MPVLKPWTWHREQATKVLCTCGKDAKSWFKQIKVYTVDNTWDDKKKLHHVSALLQGHAGNVYDSLIDK